MSTALVVFGAAAVLLPVYVAGAWPYATGRRAWAAYRPQQHPPVDSAQK